MSAYLSGLSANYFIGGNQAWVGQTDSNVDNIWDQIDASDSTYINGGWPWAFGRGLSSGKSESTCVTDAIGIQSCATMSTVMTTFYDEACDGSSGLYPGVCAKANACYGQPCLHGATCTTSADCFTSYSCTCTALWTGTNCDYAGKMHL